jgi:hypothetical protein
VAAASEGHPQDATIIRAIVHFVARFYGQTLSKGSARRLNTLRFPPLRHSM